jgi:hypothetical protein
LLCSLLGHNEPTAAQQQEINSRSYYGIMPPAAPAPPNPPPKVGILGLAAGRRAGTGGALALAAGAFLFAAAGLALTAPPRLYPVAAFLVAIGLFLSCFPKTAFRFLSDLVQVTWANGLGNLCRWTTVALWGRTLLHPASDSE